MRTLTLVTAFLVSLSATFAATPAPEHGVVWKSGDDGIKVYSIPGILVTTRGTILVYAEARHEGRGDGGKVDIAVKRSVDAGRSWSPSHFIERSRGKENYVLATLTQDRVSGRIYFFSALRDEGIGDQTTTNSYRTSDDDGVTWSQPRDITPILYAADETIQRQLRERTAPAGFAGDDPELYGRKLIFFGPGRPIQMSADHTRFPNRIVVPLFLIKDRVVTPRARRGYGNAVLVSDDGGNSWSVPGVVPLGQYGSSEVSVAELGDGRLMLNARGAPPESSGMSVAGRTLSFSSDGGSTWTTPQPDTSGIPRYIETHSGLLRITAQGKSRLLYSFPDSVPPPGEKPSSRMRANGTILMSEDDGRSWPVRKLLVPGSFGYSNMDVLPDETIAIVYENAGGTTVSVTRFTLDWLTGGATATGPITRSAIAGTRGSADAVTNEIKELDRRRLTALHQLDHATLQEIFAHDCVYVHASGRVDTKQQYLARLGAGDLRYLKLDYDGPPTIRLVGGDGAVVTARISLTAQGRTGAPNQRVLTTTSVYARRDGRWQLVAYQGTPHATP